MKRLNLLYGCLLALWILTGSCSFSKIGKDVATGLSEGISTKKIDSIGSSLMTGVLGELTSPETKKKFAKILDSVLNKLSETIKNTTADARDTILSQKTMLWLDSLRDAFTGQTMKDNLAALQAILVGRTKADVLDILNHFRGLLADVLSDSTKERLGAFRDELLGPKTNAAISKIIDSSVLNLWKSIRKDILPGVKEQTSWIKKYAIESLLILFGIASAIIFFIWRNRIKYLRLVAILSKNIHHIPDQKVYDSVTSKIKNDAILTGLEPDLNNFLKKNRLVGDSAWKKKDVE